MLLQREGPDLARLGSVATARLRPPSGEDRTTFARSEHFSV